MAAQNDSSKQIDIDKWEYLLVKTIARKFRTQEREDLSAELALTLLELKCSRQPGIRDWRSYLAKALHNRAANWVRDRRIRDHRERQLEPCDSDDTECIQSSKLVTTDTDDRFAFSLTLSRIGKVGRRLCDVLLAENGNQSRAAQRLKVHRNTIRRRILELRQSIGAAGPEPERRAVKSSAKHRSGARTKIVFPSSFLASLSKASLNGTQWRILLWVIIEVYRRKRRTAPFTWARIARALGADRSDVYRNGLRLLRGGLLFVEHARIRTASGTR